MNRLVIFLGLLLMTTQMACASDKKDNSEIHWMSFEEAELKMKEKPKKVIIDVYTSWCGWCKVMDKKTYSNDSLIRYVNENFYAVKFDAEQKTPVSFKGKKWEYSAQNRANDLAVQLMQGKMSYPTTIFMDEGFENAQPLPGYLELFQMESILKYIGGNIHKAKPFTDWQHDFKPSWKPQ
jgi:thioredoxin-related protein